jgi:hypothetical protein
LPPAVDGGPCRDALALRKDLDELAEEVSGLRGQVEVWREEQAAWRVTLEQQVDERIKAIPPPPDPGQFVPREQYEAHQAEQRQQIDSRVGVVEGHVEGLKGKLEGVAKKAAGAAAAAGRAKLDEVAIGALGIGGPIGIGVAVGLWLARRKVRSIIKHRSEERTARGSAADDRFHAYD